MATAQIWQDGVCQPFEIILVPTCAKRADQHAHQTAKTRNNLCLTTTFVWCTCTRLDNCPDSGGTHLPTSLAQSYSGLNPCFEFAFLALHKS